jgi:hypothetical protein
VRYTLAMETFVLVVLAIVVALVAIDALARLDERAARRRAAAGNPPPDETIISTQKIVIDLSKRG